MQIQVYKLHGAERFINRDVAWVYKQLEGRRGGSGRGSVRVYKRLVYFINHSRGL